MRLALLRVRVRRLCVCVWGAFYPIRSTMAQLPPQQPSAAAASGLALLSSTGLVGLKHVRGGRPPRQRKFTLSADHTYLSWAPYGLRALRLMPRPRRCCTEAIATVCVGRNSPIYASFPHHFCLSLTLTPSYESDEGIRCTGRHRLDLSFIDKESFELWTATLQHLAAVQRQRHSVAAPYLGSRVRVVGLSSTSGVAEAYDAERDRICVRMDVTGELVALNAQALEPFISRDTLTGVQPVSLAAAPAQEQQPPQPTSGGAAAAEALADAIFAAAAKEAAAENAGVSAAVSAAAEIAAAIFAAAEGPAAAGAHESALTDEVIAETSANAERSATNAERSAADAEASAADVVLAATLPSAWRCCDGAADAAVSSIAAVTPPSAAEHADAEALFDSLPACAVAAAEATVPPEPAPSPHSRPFAAVAGATFEYFCAPPVAMAAADGAADGAAMPSEAAEDAQDDAIPEEIEEIEELWEGHVACDGTLDDEGRATTPTATGDGLRPLPSETPEAAASVGSAAGGASGCHTSLHASLHATRHASRHASCVAGGDEPPRPSDAAGRAQLSATIGSLIEGLRLGAGETAHALEAARRWCEQQGYDDSSEVVEVRAEAELVAALALKPGKARLLTKRLASRLAKWPAELPAAGQAAGQAASDSPTQVGGAASWLGAGAAEPWQATVCRDGVGWEPVPMGLPVLMTAPMHAAAPPMMTMDWQRLAQAYERAEALAEARASAAC